MLLVDREGGQDAHSHCGDREKGQRNFVRVHPADIHSESPWRRSAVADRMQSRWTRASRRLEMGVTELRRTAQIPSVVPPDTITESRWLLRGTSRSCAPEPVSWGTGSRRNSRWPVPAATGQSDTQ